MKVLHVNAGLEEGERVVTAGASFLSEGRLVTVSAQSAPAAALSAAE